MKGLPKRFATADDIRNCYKLTMTGEIDPADLLEAMENLERQNYLFCGVREVSEDGKTVTIGYCAEAQAGQKAVCGDKTVTIKTVEHVKGEDDSFETTELALSAKVAEDVDTIAVPAPYNIYDSLGISKDEFDEIKADLTKLK